MNVAKNSWLKVSAIALALGVVPILAQASVLIGTVEGNDCAGALGTPPNCAAPVYDADGKAVLDDDEKQVLSPLIAKFDLFGEDDEECKTLLGDFCFTPGTFSSIDGSEFAFSFTDSGNEGKTGFWTYTPGTGDPEIVMFTAKGGSRYNLYVNTGGNSDTWTMPTNNGGNAAGFSHMSFYDTGGRVPPEEIPEPALLLLFGVGAIGLALARRRGA
jgi:hypothetical protein